MSSSSKATRDAAFFSSGLADPNISSSSPKISFTPPPPPLPEEPPGGFDPPLISKEGPSSSTSTPPLSSSLSAGIEAELGSVDLGGDGAADFGCSSAAPHENIRKILFLKFIIIKKIKYENYFEWSIQNALRGICKYLKIERVNRN